MSAQPATTPLIQPVPPAEQNTRIRTHHSGTIAGPRTADKAARRAVIQRASRHWPPGYGSARSARPVLLCSAALGLNVRIGRTGRPVSVAQSTAGASQRSSAAGQGSRRLGLPDETLTTVTDRNYRVRRGERVPGYVKRRQRGMSVQLL